MDEEWGNKQKNKKNYYNGKIKKLDKKKKFIPFTILAIILIFIFMKTTMINSDGENNTNIFKSKRSSEASSSAKSDGKFTVCIDAGHGDWDEGTDGVNDSFEKNINLAISLEIGKMLEQYKDIKVVYTRDSDTVNWSEDSHDNLFDRLKISEEANSDIFVSVHCNSSYEDEEYKGIESWYNPKSAESERLATFIQDELSSLEYTSDRGIKTYDEDETLAVLEHNKVPATLVEVGFISNYSDQEFLDSENGQKLCANAFVQGILEYKNSL